MSRAGTLGAYAAIGAEVDPSVAVAAALARGQRVAFPRVDETVRRLAFAACPPDRLLPGAHRTLQPPADAPAVPVGALDVVLVPGVAFDAAGRRLGRGRGHYDATLAALRPEALRIGLAFELQVVEDVPQEPHDALLDVLVTEVRVVFRLPHAGPRARSTP